MGIGYLNEENPRIAKFQIFLRARRLRIDVILVADSLPVYAITVTGDAGNWPSTSRILHSEPIDRCKFVCKCIEIDSRKLPSNVKKKYERIIGQRNFCLPSK